MYTFLPHCDILPSGWNMSNYPDNFDPRHVILFGQWDMDRSFKDMFQTETLNGHKWIGSGPLILFSR